MRSTLAFLGFAASAAAQAVTSIITPPSGSPAGCSSSYASSFQITVLKASGKREVELAPRQDGTLTITLSGGLLHDSDGRTGYIASNYQFQFDKPPQAGAIYTGGFSICANNYLALGGSTTFYQCLSGTFYNLYDRDWAAQCSPVYIQALPVGGTTTTSVAAVTSSSQATIPSTSSVSTPSFTFISATAASSGGSSSNGTTSATGSKSTSGSTHSSASTATTGAKSSAASSSSASGTAAATSSSAAGADATGAPQALLSWAVGIAGALALI